MILVFICVTEIQLKHHKQNITGNFSFDVAVLQRDAIFSIKTHLRCCIFGRFYFILSYYLFFFVAWSLPLGVKKQELIGWPQKVILIYY